jgi:hypothetical protein
VFARKKRERGLGESVADVLWRKGVAKVNGMLGGDDAGTAGFTGLGFEGSLASRRFCVCE